MLRIPTASLVHAGLLLVVCAALAAARDVDGNNTPWTTNDSIIFDLQRKRTLQEQAANTSKGTNQLEVWLEGKREVLPPH